MSWVPMIPEEQATGASIRTGGAAGKVLNIARYKACVPRQPNGVFYALLPGHGRSDWDQQTDVLIARFPK